MRISDWSSDVCSSDLAIEQIATVGGAFGYGRYADVGEPQQSGLVAVPSGSLHKRPDIVDNAQRRANAFERILSHRPSSLNNVRDPTAESSAADRVLSANMYDCFSIMPLTPADAFG